MEGVSVDLVVGGYDLNRWGKYRKPLPDLLFVAAAKLDLEPADLVVVTDCDRDEMAAKAAGMDAGDIENACRACGLPAKSPFPARQLSEAALRDKKRRGSKITLVLPERIGKCGLKTVDVAELPAYFAKGMGEAL